MRCKRVRTRDQLLEDSRVLHSSIGQMIDCHGECGIRMGCLILSHSMDILHDDLLTLSLFLDRCVTLLILILKHVPVIGHTTDDASVQCKTDGDLELHTDTKVTSRARIYLLTLKSIFSPYSCVSVFAESASLSIIDTSSLSILWFICHRDITQCALQLKIVS